MSNTKTILVVVDPTQGPEQCAIVRGAWLARKLNAGLELLVSRYHQYPTANGLIDPRILEADRVAQGRHLQTNLEQLAASLAPGIRNIKLTTIIDARLSEAVLGHAVATNPLLIVKEAHHHSLLDRTLLTNSDWELVRDCPVPLWLAKNAAFADDTKILASIDPTKNDERHAQLDSAILDTTKMLESALEATVHVFHSFMPMPMYANVFTEPDVFTPADADAMQFAAHSERVDQRLAGRHVDARNVHIQAGPATRLLPECATRVGASIVVMGSVTSNRLKRVFIGSTVEKVLERIACDVVVVKPKNFSCPMEARPPQDHAWRDPEPAIVKPEPDSHPPVWIP